MEQLLGKDYQLQRHLGYTGTEEDEAQLRLANGNLKGYQQPSLTTPAEQGWWDLPKVRGHSEATGEVPLHPGMGQGGRAGGILFGVMENSGIGRWWSLQSIVIVINAAELYT